MSVKVNYMGRVGNHLFQYIAGRLLAEESGISLSTAWNGPWLIPVNEIASSGSMDHNGPFQVIGDESDVLDKAWPKGNYCLSGYFQKARWYWGRREKILSISNLPPVEALPESSLVMNVRLGDYYYFNVVIHPSWYLKILEREKFDKLIIVTDEIRPDYFEHFRKYSPQIVKTERNGNVFEGIKHDWDLLRKARRMIASNSSFCWWALFFGAFEKVYTFERWVPGGDLAAFPGAEVVSGAYIQEGAAK